MIPVVTQAKVLGLPLNPNGSTTIDWNDKLAKYDRKVNYIRSRWIPVHSKMYQISSKITRKALPCNTGWRSTLYAAKLKDRGTGCLHFTAHLNAIYLKCFSKLLTSGKKIWVKLTWNVWLYIHKLQRNPLLHENTIGDYLSEMIEYLGSLSNLPRYKRPQ